MQWPRPILLQSKQKPDLLASREEMLRWEKQLQDLKSQVIEDDSYPCYRSIDEVPPCPVIEVQMGMFTLVLPGTFFGFPIKDCQCLSIQNEDNNTVLGNHWWICKMQ